MYTKKYFIIYDEEKQKIVMYFDINIQRISVKHGVLPTFVRVNQRRGRKTTPVHGVDESLVLPHVVGTL